MPIAKTKALRVLFKTLLSLAAMSPCILFAQSGSPSVSRREEPAFWAKTGAWFKGNPYSGEVPLYTAHTKLLFGAGSVGILDTYLSETTHTGLYLSLLSQTDYPIRSGRDKWHVYQEIGLYGGLPENPANSSTMEFFGGYISVGAAWRAFLSKGFSLEMAPLLTIDAQGDLKLSNTNNISNVKASFGLDAWARLRYRLPLDAFPMRAQYTVRMPLLHGAFSPSFGQSYYEFVAGESRVMPLKFYPLTVFNGIDVRQQLLLDLPIRHFTLTIGAEYGYKSHELNHLRFRQGSWAGLVGVSFDLFNISGNRSIRSPYIRNAID